MFIMHTTNKVLLHLFSRQKVYLKLAFLIYILIVLVGHTMHQSQSPSIQEQLNNHPQPDTIKVKLLNRFASSIWNKDPLRSDSIARIAMNLSRSLDYTRGEAKALRHIAIAQWMLDNYKDAFQYVTESLKIHESIQNESGIIECYGVMALIMDDQGDYQKALEYHHIVFQKRVQAGDSLDLSRTMNNIASVYYKRNDLDTALQYFLQSLYIREQLNHAFGIKESCSNLSVVYRELGDFDKALMYVKRAIALADKIDDNVGMLNTRLNLADIFSDMRLLDSAELSYQKLLPVAQELGLKKRIVEIYSGLRKVAEKRKNYKQALYYADKYKTVKDSIAGQQSQKVIAQLEAQYQSEKKEKEIVTLQQEAKNRKLWLNIFAIGILGTLIFGSLLFLSLRYRAQKKEALLRAESAEKAHLEELNAMKSKFFNNISHEFKTPLTLIKGPVEQLLAKTEDVSKKHMLQIINKNADQLDKLIHQLLELSRLDLGQIQLKANLIDVLPHFKAWTGSFRSLAEDKNIQLNFHSDQADYHMFVETEKIEHAFTNLLSNAVKFTPSGGQVDVLLSMQKVSGKEYLRIQVKDTGIGIPQKAQEQIFERFYQAHHTEEGSGTGIGLAIAKDYVEIHCGQLSVESIPKVGSTFTILLPFGKEHLQPEEIAVYPAHQSLPDEQASKQMGKMLNAFVGTPIDTSALSILIAEDHVDLSDYLKSILQPAYAVFQAPDGKAALDIALNTIPDMVISDIMMPEMNGMELCQRIKKDSKTSHIPVILLTAKSSDEDRIAGMQSQADAYLTKPFNRQELLAVIQSLFDNRKKLQDYFRLQETLSPVAANNIPSSEQKFINTMNTLLEKNLSDELYGVEQLSNDMLMSRSQLHRKLKAIANVTPSAYIRTYRLKKAKQLLTAKAGNVSEICFDVGFSNPSYFAKVFQEEFGVRPGEILRK